MFNIMTLNYYLLLQRRTCFGWYFGSWNRKLVVGGRFIRWSLGICFRQIRVILVKRRPETINLLQVKPISLKRLIYIRSLICYVIVKRIKLQEHIM